MCPAAASAMRAIIGLQIGRGWNKEVQRRLPPASRCTHLAELLGPMATAALQAMSGLRQDRPDPVDAQGRPLQLGTCYAYSPHSDLVKRRWPDFMSLLPSRLKSTSDEDDCVTDFLIYEQQGPVVTLTMNDPARRNPLTGNSAIPEFLAAIDRIHDDYSVRCVILTGNGPSFCAGGDINEMKRQATPEVSEIAIRHEYRRGIQRLTLALFNLEVPVIAAVNGHAIGAGLDLACMCDIRIAAEKAKFAESFIRLGIIPGDGGAWLLPRIVGLSAAAEMAFAGDMIDAEQALQMRLISKIVPGEELLAAARELAGRIARNPSHGIRLSKRLMRESLHSRLSDVLELSAAYQAISHKTADHSEAVEAFLEKREPRFD
jgi:enoyl-CoA hydratase/carnithine racemase